MINNRKNEFKSALTGFGVIFLYLVASAFSQDFLNIFNIKNIIAKQIYNIVFEIILTLIIIYIYKDKFIPDFKYFIKNNANIFKKYIKYWFIMIFFMTTSNAIVTFFTSTNVAQNQQSIIDSLNKYPIYTFILTVFIAPILEELVFRLSFRKIFSKSNLLFIFFSGLVFGSLHVLGTISSLYDLLFIIPYSIPGFIFAYLLAKSDNICITMSLHFIHNGIMLLLQILLILL